MNWPLEAPAVRPDVYEPACLMTWQRQIEAMDDTCEYEPPAELEAEGGKA